MRAVPPPRPADPATTRPPGPRLLVTAFTDFVCPFCYIGHVRLLQLRAQYDLRVNWCLIEIHPDNPPQGRPLSELGYPQAQWQRMMEVLARMAEEEGIAFAPRRFTTNSRRALQLAEAAKDEGSGVFYAVAEALYRAYFRDGRNIGDEAVLRSVAQDTGLAGDFAERAWSDPEIERRLQAHLARARMAGVRATPTFVIGGQIIPGAVPAARLRAAAEAAIGPVPPDPT